ncbi:hypothetical protein [Streptomyces sp. NPDC048442]|uniref:hypothetical protein n=1 Tax=Streptomyces sp. NPDC048442 TaxID=3154823 RepID=UPI0034370B83
MSSAKPPDTTVIAVIGFAATFGEGLTILTEPGPDLVMAAAWTITAVAGGYLLRSVTRAGMRWLDRRFADQVTRLVGDRIPEPSTQAAQTSTTSDVASLSLVPTRIDEGLGPDTGA